MVIVQGAVLNLGGKPDLSSDSTKNCQINAHIRVYAALSLTIFRRIWAKYGFPVVQREHLLILKYVFFMLLYGLSTVTALAESHHPEDFLKRIAGKPGEGSQIVQHYCANCHAPKPLIQLGAPRMGQASDWHPRTKQGWEVLFKHTDEGVRAMPARGGCFECSDQQLWLAVLSMIPESIVRSNNPPHDVKLILNKK